MAQLEGIIDPLKPHFYCKLRKALYGLKQALQISMTFVTCLAIYIVIRKYLKEVRIKKNIKGNFELYSYALIDEYICN